ncbi:hypothetical protein [Streptosporangium roseum]|uniref:hypothetical protein n=1 Tax=Streptosporangium roseum TaxID=2001 RepID=UPI00332D1AF4
MATRHNLCVNPALGVDVSGWGGGSTPARTDVSSLGFGRSWAARYTGGSFLSTAATQSGAVVAGQTYTLSVYYRPTSFAASGTLYVEWINGSGGGFGYPNVPFSGGAATISRASITEVAPAGAVAARIILDGINFGVSAMDATMVLIEQAATLLDYFDGDSPNGSWNGTPGLSASTLSDAAPVTGTSDVSLPPMESAGSGTARTSGLSAVALPALTTTASGTATTSGTVTADLPALESAGTGTAKTAGVHAAALPSLGATGSGTAKTTGTSDAALPLLESAAAGTATTAGHMDVTLPALVADTATPQADDDITIRVVASRRGWSARTGRRSWSARTGRH